MRRPFIAGNWKMNLDRKSAHALASALRERVGQRADLDLALFPPFVYLDEVARALAGSKIQLGAQNCCDEAKGAFTGEISAGMVLDVGASWVLLGHSERRHLYGESDGLIQAKVQAALNAGLKVMLCVGETLAEREAKRTESVIGSQLQAGLKGVVASELGRIAIAYEPVWAIGTGVNATTAQASQAHAYLRGVLAGLYQEAAAARMQILYGGSVKASIARELLAAPDVDGCLVGGASLETQSFLGIIEGAPRL
jgi:triosephosphate isomerase (TIM)